MYTWSAGTEATRTGPDAGFTTQHYGPHDPRGTPCRGETWSVDDAPGGNCDGPPGASGNNRAHHTENPLGQPGKQPVRPRPDVGERGEAGT